MQFGYLRADTAVRTKAPDATGFCPEVDEQKIATGEQDDAIGSELLRRVFRKVPLYRPVRIKDRHAARICPVRHEDEPGRMRKHTFRPVEPAA